MRYPSRYINSVVDLKWNIEPRPITNWEKWAKTICITPYQVERNYNPLLGDLWTPSLALTNCDIFWELFVSRTRNTFIPIKVESTISWANPNHKSIGTWHILSPEQEMP